MVIDYSKEVREVAAALRAYHEIEHRSNTSRINYMRGLAEEDFLRLYSKDLAIGELLRGLLHAGIQIKPLVPFESSEGSYDERKRTVKEGSAKAIFDNNDLKNYVERLDKLFKESRQKFKMAQALGGTIVDSADTAVVDGVETLVQVATPNRKHLVVWIDIKAVTSTPDRTYDTYIPSFGFYDFKKERITGFIEITDTIMMGSTIATKLGKALVYPKDLVDAGLIVGRSLEERVKFKEQAIENIVKAIS